MCASVNNPAKKKRQNYKNTENYPLLCYPLSNIHCVCLCIRGNYCGENTYGYTVSSLTRLTLALIRARTLSHTHGVMDRSWLRASVRGDCSNQSSGERDKGENNECGIGPFIAQQKATGSDRHTQCGEERKGGEEKRRGEGEKGRNGRRHRSVRLNEGMAMKRVCK